MTLLPPLRGRVAVLCVMAGVFAAFLALQLLVQFHIVRASVCSKARPVEGPDVATALRRAASKANLQALLSQQQQQQQQHGKAAVAEGAAGTHAPAAASAATPRRSAMRRGGVPRALGELPAAHGNRVHFGGADLEASGAL